jgi:hypothetical protein
MDTGRLVRAGTPAEVFADASYLRDRGLGLPQATEMAEALGLGGAGATGGDPAGKHTILGTDELVEAIVRARAARGGETSPAKSRGAYAPGENARAQKEPAS